MGASPSTPSVAQSQELKSRLPELIERAACAVGTADVLIFCSGAGWSVDSGILAYKDVADLPAYNARSLTYRDLCVPHLLAQDPALFTGFWGSCFNVYRDTPPHEGYSIVASWRDQQFSRPPLQPSSCVLWQRSLWGRRVPFFPSPPMWMRIGTQCALRRRFTSAMATQSGFSAARPRIAP